MLKRYSNREIALDLLEVSVLSLNCVAYVKDFQDIWKRSSKTCISRGKTNLAHI